MGPYLDTSALAKWYLNEPFSEKFEAFIQEYSTAAISRLTVVELRCLLARRRRDYFFESLYNPVKSLLSLIDLFSFRFSSITAPVSV